MEEGEMGSMGGMLEDSPPTKKTSSAQARSSRSRKGGTISKKKKKQGPSGLVPPETVLLHSVKSLCDEVNAATHPGLAAVFEGHKFVGAVDAQFSVIQHETKLYLLDMSVISSEMFYQLGLAGFGSFPRFVFSNRPKVADLLQIALDDPRVPNPPGVGSDPSVYCNSTAEFLMAKAEMMEEYFGLVLDPEDGSLVGIPQLLPSFLPPLWKLPAFFIHLGTEVDWTNEASCFSSFLRALAKLYSLAPEQRMDGSVMPGGETPLAWAIEHTLFPALRGAFYPPSALATNGAVLQIAQLQDLYKVFERC